MASIDEVQATLEAIMMRLRAMEERRLASDMVEITEGLSDMSGSLGLQKAGELRFGSGTPGKGDGFTGLRISNEGMIYDGEDYLAVSVVNDEVEWGILADGTTSGGGGGTMELTNQSGGEIVEGDVVILDIENDSSFTTTDRYWDPRVIGVAGETIANGEAGAVLVDGQIASVLTYGTVANGDWLVTSSDVKTAISYSRRQPDVGAIGYALESHSSDASLIDVALKPSPRHFYTSGIGYEIAGSDTGKHNEIDSLDFATEIWTAAGIWNRTIAGSATGASETDAYLLGGLTTVNVNTITKMPFATESVSDVSDTLGLARSYLAFVQGTEKAGIGPGSPDNNAVDSFTYATDTRSAYQAAGYPVGSLAMDDGGSISDGVDGYSFGGRDGVTNRDMIAKFTFATDVWADEGANLSAARGYVTTATDSPANPEITYIHSGYNSSGMTVIDKFVQATTTITVHSDSASVICWAGGGVSAPDAGYFTIGWNASGASYSDAVDVMDWATGVISAGNATNSSYRDGYGTQALA